jgi:hypothetical protein
VLLISELGSPDAAADLEAIFGPETSKRRRTRPSATQSRAQGKSVSVIHLETCLLAWVGRRAWKALRCTRY